MVKYGSFVENVSDTEVGFADGQNPVWDEGGYD